MRDEARELQVGDRLSDEPVVEFLRFVQFVTAGNAACVNVSDVLNVVAQRLNDVTLHDLRVIDVVQNLDTWRTDALYDVHTPRHAVEHAVHRTLKTLGVEVFDAER